MISIEQLEVMLRTVPQYFLFGAASLYIFGWIDRKPKLSLIAECLLVTIGILSFLVMTIGVIPSPLEPGIVKEHIEMLINMLILLSVNGVLAAISITIRLLRKKAWNPLVFGIFLFSIFIFFSSTKLSQIKFELTPAENDTTEITLDN